MTARKLGIVEEYMRIYTKVIAGVGGRLARISGTRAM
jgi:hypothetical protein